MIVLVNRAIIDIPGWWNCKRAVNTWPAPFLDIGSAYLFVNRSDSDAVSSSDPDCHIIELRENDELERTNHARPRPLVRSSTQLTLDNLQFTSKFTKKEVSQLYREFKFECPAGHVTKEQFRSLYQKCYPLGGQLLLPIA